MRQVILFTVLILSLGSSAQDTLPYAENRTFEHADIILRYARLERDHPDRCKLIKGGLTDAEVPLHLFVIDPDGTFNADRSRDNNRNIVFINNGIHPGEPCGVDASYKLAIELLDKDRGRPMPPNTVVCIVPIYNVGGALNRNCCTRANQNGPEEYGFRGNAQNLDLNRDFIKCDSRNAFALISFLRTWDPDVFVDTHTSNGADYQHVMTLITSQPDKLGPELASFTRESFEPFLYDYMEEAGFPMCPYMNTIGETPEEGIMDYLETPRYSTGYTALFQTIGFVSEAHMLKPFKDRVMATYDFLNGIIDFTELHGEKIRSLRQAARLAFQNYNSWPLDWEADTSVCTPFPFKGFKAVYETSAVTGRKQLHYDRSQPYMMDINCYHHFRGTDSVRIPSHYIIPRGWKRVIDRLDLNGVQYSRFTADTTIEVEVYYIDSLETKEVPYEGHYLHSNIHISAMTDAITFKAGDYLIPTNQAGGRFLVEVLEPHAPDSYFAWNFFDAILQQKEWFSSYVFEQEAAKMLEADPGLKARFEEKKSQDPTFAQSPFQQLYYLYTQSPHYEKNHRRYPVFRVMP